MTTHDALQRGRHAFERQAWTEAFDQLAAADDESSLGPADLERLGVAAHLMGRDDEGEDAMARAHHEFLRLGEAPRAARTAFWLGMGLVNRGEMARGGGCLVRACLEQLEGQRVCVES